MNGYQVQRRHNHRWITMGVGTLETAAKAAHELSATYDNLVQLVSPGGFTVLRLAPGDQTITPSERMH
jgi:hypothetical protein